MRVIYKERPNGSYIKGLMYESMYEFLNEYRSHNTERDESRKKEMMGWVNVSSLDEMIQKMYDTDSLTAKDKKEIFTVCSKEIKRPVKSMVGSSVSIPLALQGVPKSMYKRSKVEHPLKRIYFHNNIDGSYSNKRLKETMVEEINGTLDYVHQGIDTEIYLVSSNYCDFTDPPTGHDVDRLTLMIPLKRFGQTLNVSRMLGPSTTAIFIRGIVLAMEVIEAHGHVGVDRGWRDTIKSLDLGYDGVCIG